MKRRYKDVKSYGNVEQHPENGSVLAENAPEMETAAPSAVNTESGTETMVSRQTDNTASARYNSTERPELQVFPLLLRGEENAIPARELADRLGLRDTRALRLLISAERRHKVILSTMKHGGGYFLPASGAKGKVEIARFVGMMAARQRHTLETVLRAQKELGELDGQEVIKEDYDGGGTEKIS